MSFSSFKRSEGVQDASLRAKALKACREMSEEQLRDHVATLYYDNMILNRKFQMLTGRVSPDKIEPLTSKETGTILSAATAFENWMGDDAKRRYLIAITEENIRLEKGRCTIL